MYEKRLKEIDERRAAIRVTLEGEAEVDLEKIKKELDALEAEEQNLTQRAATAERLNRGGINGAIVTPNPITGAGAENRTRRPTDYRAAVLADLQGIDTIEAEQRAAQFAEAPQMSITSAALKRSFTLSSGAVAQPSRVSGINPGPNDVSGIIDMVHVVDAAGMGRDSVAYETAGMEAKVKKSDGTATTESAAGYAVADITPVLVSTIAYIDKNIQRTTPLNYQERTSAKALTALRKKVSRLIVAGDPAASTPEITGMLKAAAIDAGTDITVKTIDETTLRKIALSYGGDDSVEGGGVLLLNKKDLIAFGDIRGTTDKKAVYEIEFDEGSTTVGTIKDGGLAVRFCLNNELVALSDSATTAGKFGMIYGKPFAYQLDLFGDYTVEVSRDYKFAEGLLAVMGEVMVGGNVVSQNGFLRVKKGA